MLLSLVDIISAIAAGNGSDWIVATCVASAGLVPVDGSAGRRSTPLASQQAGELGGGADVGIVGHVPVVAEHPGVVDEQGVERAALGDVDVVAPRGDEELVVVARAVADDAAVDLR